MRSTTVSALCLLTAGVATAQPTGGFVALVLVRMVFHRELAIRAFQRFLITALGHTKHIIIVAFAHR